MAMRDTVIFDRKLLTAARMGRTMTRADLRAATALSKNLIWRAHNNRPVSLHVAQRIAKALRTSLKSLLAESNDQSDENDAKHVGWKNAVGGVVPEHGAKQSGALNGPE